jgi:hypothetical protein
MRWVVLATWAAAGCGPEPAPPPEDGLGGAAMRLETGWPTDFWRHPFPSSHRRRVDGRVDLAGFPNPADADLLRQLRDLLEAGARGFSQMGAVWIPFDGPLDPTRAPALEATLDGDAVVQLVDVDPDSAERGRRFPVAVRVGGGLSGYEPAHGVALLPHQGLPLRPRTRYAAIVQRSLTDADGAPLSTAPALRALRDGDVPEGWTENQAADWQLAFDQWREEGRDPAAIAGLSVFSTWRANAGLDAFYEAGKAAGVRISRGLSFVEATEDACVYATEITVPNFQQGSPPYAEGEGTFAVDAQGEPVLQGRAPSRLVVTWPRRDPVAPAPVVVFIRTGGGGDRPLVDRGPREVPGQDAGGTGYANTFARAGYAAVSWDGPLGGVRNPTGGDEQFLVFDLTNPGALRDNLRQTALEAAWLPAILPGLLIPRAECPLLTVTEPRDGRLDASSLVLFGHSMGATVAPIALSLTDTYDAAILSGAGGSWIENIVHKLKPIPVKAAAAAILGEPADTIDVFHPGLSLLQWGGEPAEPVVYAGLIGDEAPPGRAPDLLVFQGIVDRYILPPIANALQVALGLDLAGDPLDEDLDYRPLSADLALVGRRLLPLPIGWNRGGPDHPRTAVVVHHAEDGVEDGHEAAFQDPWSYHQVRCFLERRLDGGTVAAAPGEEGDPCPRVPAAPLPD